MIKLTVLTVVTVVEHAINNKRERKYSDFAVRLSNSYKVTITDATAIYQKSVKHSASVASSGILVY